MKCNCTESQNPLMIVKYILMQYMAFASAENDVTEI